MLPDSAQRSGGSDRLRSDLMRLGRADVRSVCKSIRHRVCDQRCLTLLAIGLCLRFRRLLAVGP